MPSKDLPRFHKRFFGIGFLMSLFVFLLMLLHESEGSLFIFRYSLSYTLSLAIALASTLAFGLAWFLSLGERLPKYPFPRTRPFAILAIVLGSLVLALFWAFLPGSRQDAAIVLFRLYTTAILVSGLAYLVWRCDHSFSLSTGQLLGLGAILILVALVISILFLGKIPPSRYYDEPLVANYAVTCARTGIIGSPFLPPRDTAFLKISIPLMWCWTGIFMETFGISLANARLAGLILVWLSTPFVFWIARRFYGNAGAILASALVIILPLNHSYLRGDSYVPLALSIALFAYLKSKDGNSLFWAFLVGLISVSAIDGHRLGIRLAPIFGLIYLWDYIQTIRRKRAWSWFLPFWFFALGASIYAVIFYYLRVILWAQTDIWGFIALTRVAYDEQLLIGQSVSTLVRIQNLIQFGIRDYLLEFPLEMLFALVGFAFALYRRQNSEKLLIAISILSFAFYLLISPKHTPYYYIHNLPLTALWIGAILSVLQDTAKNLNTLGLALSLFIFSLFMAFYIDLGTSRSQNADELMAASFDINAVLPEDLQVITGHQVFYWGLANRQFYDLNTFAIESVDDARFIWNLPEIQAVIFVAGFDNHPTVQVYIEEMDMQQVRCYPVNFFGGRVLLYVLPEFVSQIPEQSCR